jgi:hypothetical protein
MLNGKLKTKITTERASRLIYKSLMRHLKILADQTKYKSRQLMRRSPPGKVRRIKNGNLLCALVIKLHLKSRRRAHPFFFTLLGAQCGDFACESAYEHGHKTPIERRKKTFLSTIAFGEILIPIYMLMKIYGPLKE